jgi:hypothetical protein
MGVAETSRTCFTVGAEWHNPAAALKAEENGTAMTAGRRRSACHHTVTYRQYRLGKRRKRDSLSKGTKNVDYSGNPFIGEAGPALC